jgi:hypothetical protein
MNPLVRTCLVIGLLALPLGLARVAAAQGTGTPDGVTPSVEAMCDGMSGAAYGLCVSYCEANDCDLEPGSQECATLRRNYTKITGRSSFPCDGATEN